jgi:hypothetical protein
MTRPVRKFKMVTTPESAPSLIGGAYSASHRVSTYLCREIAKKWATDWYAPVDASTLQDLYSQGLKWSNEAPATIRDTFHDYLTGAGIVINPFPSDTAHFYQSDLQALNSDWEAVRYDIESVWQTVATMHDWLEEHVSDERSAEWKQASGEPASGEQSGPAEPTISEDRSHTPGAV